MLNSEFQAWLPQFLTVDLEKIPRNWEQAYKLVPKPQHTELLRQTIMYGWHERFDVIETMPEQALPTGWYLMAFGNVCDLYASTADKASKDTALNRRFDWGLTAQMDKIVRASISTGSLEAIKQFPLLVRLVADKACGMRIAQTSAPVPRGYVHFHTNYRGNWVLTDSCGLFVIQLPGPTTLAFMRAACWFRQQGNFEWKAIEASAVLEWVFAGDLGDMDILKVVDDSLTGRSGAPGYPDCRRYVRMARGI